MVPCQMLKMLTSSSLFYNSTTKLVHRIIFEILIDWLILVVSLQLNSWGVTYFVAMTQAETLITVSIKKNKRLEDLNVIHLETIVHCRFIYNMPNNKRSWLAPFFSLPFSISLFLFLSSIGHTVAIENINENITVQPHCVCTFYWTLSTW